MWVGVDGHGWVLVGEGERVHNSPVFCTKPMRLEKSMAGGCDGCGWMFDGHGWVLVGEGESVHNSPVFCTKPMRLEKSMAGGCNGCWWM